MKVYAKILMAGVNFVCLAITLFYPNSATPFALLPILVGVSTWIFVNNRGDRTKKEKRGIATFLIIVTVLGASCVVIGVMAKIGKNDQNTITPEISSYETMSMPDNGSSSINKDNNDVNKSDVKKQKGIGLDHNGYSIQVNDEVALIGGWSKEYDWFLLFFGVTIFALIIFETIACCIEMKRKNEEAKNSGQSIDQIARQVVISQIV